MTRTILQSRRRLADWLLALRMRRHGDPVRLWRGAVVVIDGGRR